MTKNLFALVLAVLTVAASAATEPQTTDPFPCNGGVGGGSCVCDASGCHKNSG